MILYLTWFVGRAWAVLCISRTWILAFRINACHIWCAIIIMCALSFIGRTNQFTVFVNNEAKFAYAHRPMASCFAAFIWLACKMCGIAWIDALAICAACKRFRAIAITRTGGAQIIWSWRCACIALRICFALNICIANVAAGTWASRPMQRCFTQCITAACVAQRARIGADIL